jgi:hypothetical protein
MMLMPCMLCAGGKLKPLRKAAQILILPSVRCLQACAAMCGQGTP